MFKNYPDWTKAIHKEGHIFIIIFAAITFLFSSASTSFGWICFMATVWCVYFFRDPVRIVPNIKGGVISPADGIVQSISNEKPPVELGLDDQEMIRISVFLNIFNIHVNRVPSDGKIVTLHYHPGKFFNASLDKASVHNERQSVLMETSTGHKIVFVQIAGLLARRIVCELEENLTVSAGQKFGIIRFGSRVDVYLPIGTSIKIAVGQTMVAGETIIADLTEKKQASINFENR